MTTQNIDLISHLPHCPDLAPNDFFLFPYVKTKMRGQRFSTPEEECMVWRYVPQSEWQKCCDNWFKRKEKCIDIHGEYSEKQLSDFRWLIFVFVLFIPKYKRQPPLSIWLSMCSIIIMFCYSTAAEQTIRIGMGFPWDCVDNCTIPWKSYKS